MPNSAALADITNISIDSTGRILVILSDGSIYIRGQLLLDNFRNTQALKKRWLYLYGDLDAAGPLSSAGRAGRQGLGSVVSGALDGNLPEQIFRWGSILFDRHNDENKIFAPGAATLSTLQISEDLVKWVSVYTNHYPGSLFEFTDRSAPEPATRFYRLISPVIKQTGVATDLAISGEGLFIVRSPASGALFATRAGNFRLDADKFLVTSDGLRVQGYNTSIQLNEEYANDAPVGDVKLDKGRLPQGIPENAALAGLANVSIDGAGKIQILLSDGRQYTHGQILLQNFKNPFALLKVRDWLFSVTSRAEPLARPGKPNTEGLGRIDSGALELFPET